MIDYRLLWSPRTDVDEATRRLAELVSGRVSGEGSVAADGLTVAVSELGPRSVEISAETHGFEPAMSATFRPDPRPSRACTRRCGARCRSPSRHSSPTTTRKPVWTLNGEAVLLERRGGVLMVDPGWSWFQDAAVVPTLTEYRALSRPR